MTSTASAFPLQSYWRVTRAPRYSLLFALPLLVFYEVLAATLPLAGGGGGPEWRNGADVLLRAPFVALLGPRGPLVFEAGLIAVGLWLVVRDRRAHGTGLRWSWFLAMLGESLLLAILLGVVAGGLTSSLLRPLERLALALAGAPGQAPGTLALFTLSLGAGLYEELLFRVILVASLAYGARALLGWRPWVAGTAAVLLGATLFSAFHYVGPYGDHLELYSFVYRMIGGLFFSALYLLRGFGVTAWTHALYDVLVLVL